jgi:hypothetical protein
LHVLDIGGVGAIQERGLRECLVEWLTAHFTGLPAARRTAASWGGNH